MGAILYLLQEDRRKYLNNPLTGYLHMNSVRKKTADLQITMQSLLLEYLLPSGTKLNESFPNLQFHLDSYEIRASQDSNKNGSVFIKFFRRGIICKRISDFKLSFSECICSERTISKNKYLCFSISRPPGSSNLFIFFEEISVSLSKAILKYQNVIIMGDFNIDLKTKVVSFNKLREFCDLFNLTNLIKSEACFTKPHKSLIDLFLNNKPLSFQKKILIIETGLSNYHNLHFFKSHFTRLRPKVIT